MALLVRRARAGEGMRTGVYRIRRVKEEQRIKLDFKYR